nr:ribonuclease H-like domain-containing protein [Tanacetum cinerariifolium]
MVTCFRVRTNRPTERLNLHVSLVSPLPKSYREAFNDVNWHSAMRDEYNELIKNSSLHYLNFTRPDISYAVQQIGLAVLLLDDRLQVTVSFLATIYSLGLLSVNRRFLVSVPRQSIVEFAMTDLGSLNYFLDISVIRDSSGMFLSQKKYAVEFLKRAGMVNCNPSRTPVDTESKLGTT